MKVVGVDYLDPVRGLRRAGRHLLHRAAPGRLPLPGGRARARACAARIDLRQIGSRDAARLTGGSGNCGRDLCCATFLKDFEPVSLRMAKVQDLPRQPDAISGACGRLMCCLKYEHPLYAEFAREVPAVGAPVTAPTASGAVVAHQVPADAVVVRMAAGAVSTCSRASVCGSRHGVRGARPRAPPRRLRSGQPARRGRRAGRASPQPAAPAPSAADGSQRRVRRLRAGAGRPRTGRGDGCSSARAPGRRRAVRRRCRAWTATPADGRPLQPVPDVLVPGSLTRRPGPGTRATPCNSSTWEPCGGRVQCATVRAPLDWSAPDGQALTLAVGGGRRRRRRGSAACSSTPAGPGGSGLNYLRYFEVRGLERYDIVELGPPRGRPLDPGAVLGRRQALDRLFSIDSSPDDAAEAADAQRGGPGFGRDCLRRSGALLRTSPPRRPCATSSCSAGWSGTRSCTTSVRPTAPTSARSTRRPTRDGPGRWCWTARSTSAATPRWTSCRASSGPSTTSRPGARATLPPRLDPDGRARRRVRAAGRSGRRPAARQRGAAADPAARGVGDPVPAVRRPRGLAVLARALADAVEERAGANLLALADASNERGRGARYSQFVGAFPAIRCLDSQATSVAAADREAAALMPKAPVLGPYAGAGPGLPAVAGAPGACRAAVDAAGVASPIVVVGTTGDPATPYEWAKGCTPSCARPCWSASTARGTWPTTRAPACGSWCRPTWSTGGCRRRLRC